MWLFADKKIIFDKITKFLTNRQFWGWPQYGVASLCNELLTEFSSNQFGTLHRCCKHIENVHVILCWWKNNFWQNYRIFNLDNYEVRPQYRAASLCNQLLSEFSSIQFEFLHRYYKHIEDVHVTFCWQKFFFDKIIAFLTLTFQTLVFSIGWCWRVLWGGWGRGRWGYRARGRNWWRDRARDTLGHHLCLTAAISSFFFFILIF